MVVNKLKKPYRLTKYYENHTPKAARFLFSQMCGNYEVDYYLDDYEHTYMAYYKGIINSNFIYDEASPYRNVCCYSKVLEFVKDNPI